MLAYSSLLTISGDPSTVATIGQRLERTIEGQLRPVKRMVDGQVLSSFSLWSSNELHTSNPDDAEEQLCGLLGRAEAALRTSGIGSARLIAQVVVRVRDGECRGFYFSPMTVVAASKIGAALEVEADAMWNEPT